MLALVNREEFLDDVLSVFEFFIMLLKSQFDIHCVVFVGSQTESIPLQCVSVAHPAIAQVNLTSLWERILL
jgi:hypothetical protein